MPKNLSTNYIPTLKASNLLDPGLAERHYEEVFHWKSMGGSESVLFQEETTLAAGA